MPNALAQITFLNTPPSPALEEHVMARIEGLEQLFERITSCRVFIEAPARHHRKGGVYQVRVELHVPGEHLVVGRPTHHQASHEDPYAAVDDAFRALRRQLEGHLQKRRDVRNATA